MELLNQSDCSDLLNNDDRAEFDPEIMICAGDIENGGRDACDVSHQYVKGMLEVSGRTEVVSGVAACNHCKKVHGFLKSPGLDPRLTDTDHMCHIQLLIPPVE